MNWIKTNDLENWANTLEARGHLPQIIRSLCLATLDKISYIDFPAYESIQRPGFDGILSVKKGNSFAPDGLSGWEK